MDAKFSGNGADLPMFGVEPMTNLGTGFWANDLGSSSLFRGFWETDRRNDPADHSRYNKETADAAYSTAFAPALTRPRCLLDRERR